MVILFIILTVVASWFNPNKTYKKNYFRQYYYQEQHRSLVFIDKVVRFSCFTVMWASMLQFMHFENQPIEFNIWNGFLNIFMFVLYVLYPLVLTLYLWRKTKNITQDTY